MEVAATRVVRLALVQVRLVVLSDALGRFTKTNCAHHRWLLQFASERLRARHHVCHAVLVAS